MVCITIDTGETPRLTWKCIFPDWAVFNRISKYPVPTVPNSQTANVIFNPLMYEMIHLSVCISTVIIVINNVCELKIPSPSQELTCECVAEALTGPKKKPPQKKLICFGMFCHKEWRIWSFWQMGSIFPSATTGWWIHPQAAFMVIPSIWMNEVCLWAQWASEHQPITLIDWVNVVTSRL